MDRELTYQMPFERLVKLSRSAGRKAFRLAWVLYWLALGAYLGGIALLIVFDEPIQSWQAAYGLPWFSAFLAVLALFVAMVLAVRRYGRQQMKARADYQSTVRLRQDGGGLRFATDEVEYYIKWPGISQMLMERDGVAVSHGSLFFLIPDGAFADLQERNAFIRDVFARLGAEARARSEAFVRPVLDAPAGAAAGP